MKDSLKVKILLVAIVILAASLRLYRLGEIPNGLSVDEAAVGYNAYSIANFGKDEWGNTFPLVFRSFGEYKMPVHIYFTALSTKLLGISEFSTRLPSAVFGIFCVIALFFLTKLLFQNNVLALLAAFFLAISPWNLQFSRVAWETNFALFFFLLGTILFILSIKDKKVFLPLSTLTFIISFSSYNASKIFVPLFVSLLIIVYLKRLNETGIYGKMSLLIVTIFITILVLVPQLTGYTRSGSIGVPISSIEKTFSYSAFHLVAAGKLEVVILQYLSHFSTSFLFLSGDPNLRHSIQTVGEFYKIEALFLLVGLISLSLKREREGLVLMAWAFLAPLPSSLFDPAPHASRAMFMMGSWTIISALGFYKTVDFFKLSYARIMIPLILLGVLGWNFKDYIKSYYGDYSVRSAREWQYGMREVENFIAQHNEYKSVYTEVYYQPYIYTLFYLKIPVGEFLASGKRREDGWVVSFDRYTYENWDYLRSLAKTGAVYIIDQTDLKDLKKSYKLDVKKEIDYPDGRKALYIVQII